MSKLHQLLAVEGDLKGLYNSILAETKQQFQKHTDRYFEYHARTELFDESDPEEADSHKVMDDMVQTKLEYTSEHIVRFLDARFQLECTNQVAVGNIVIGNEVIATDVPATFLLGLESKLASIRDTIYKTIPTLQPGVLWIEDETMPSGVVKKKDPDEKFRTKKIRKNHVLALSTKEHPEQVEVYTEDVKVARILTDTWCSMYSSRQKAAVLARIDKLIRAVKKARQDANATKVKEVLIGDALFNYIHNKVDL